MTLNNVIDFDYFLSIRIFPFLLLLSFVILIFHYWVLKRTSRFVCVIIEFVFCAIIIIQTLITYQWMKKTPGEAGFGMVEIIMYIPILLLFIIYMSIDISKSYRNNDDVSHK